METMEPTESKESLEELFEQLGNILADMENPELYWRMLLCCMNRE